MPPHLAGRPNLIIIFFRQRLLLASFSNRGIESVLKGSAMDSRSSDAKANGRHSGALEKSTDPAIPRVGDGNRVSADPQPGVMSPPPDQLGRGDPQQPSHDSKPKDKKEKDDKNKRDDQSPKGDADNRQDEPQKPPFYKRLIPMAILIAVVLILAVGGTLYWLHARQFESTDDAFIQAHVTPISPKVAALVDEVDIDDNNFVHQGQVLVKLDPRDFQSALNQAKANEAAMRGQLSQAKSNLEVSQASVQEAQAELTVAQVNFENADRNFKRYQALDARATSRQQLDNVTAEERGNDAQVTQAKAKVAQMQAQVDAAQSQIQIAQANVDKAVADRQTAQLNLSYCTIVSPQDGYITRKSVEPGSYVQVGQVLFSTVPQNVWVVANFKETQLDAMRPGQPVDVHVDAYPDKTFHGKVDSIEAGTGAQFSLLPPENATGNYVKVVQRVPVKIIFDPGETDDQTHILGVGLSVEPDVKIK
jgi:membrane fusion protein, multidrug efflux system